jgi:hypothetical protein
MVRRDRAITVLELFRVIIALPAVESTRRTKGFEGAVSAMRARGTHRFQREWGQRVFLQRAIAWLDSHIPGGTNCYRRVLLELSLDAGAAGEPVVIGLNPRGGPGSGHVWLASSTPPENYEVKLAL